MLVNGPNTSGDCVYCIGFSTGFLYVFLVNAHTTCHDNTTLRAAAWPREFLDGQIYLEYPQAEKPELSQGRRDPFLQGRHQNWFKLNYGK